MFVITGHRGAMAHAPENTMRSFALAVDAGTDELELDVHLSRDGELVVVHDETLDRTTDGTGPVSDHDWAAIATLDAGAGERVPRLAQVLDAFPGTAFQIEVKVAAATAAVLDVVRERTGRPGALVITSAHVDALGPALVTERGWRVGLICGRHAAAAVAQGAALGVDRLYLHWDVADQAAAAGFAAAGGPVYVWPCNDAASVRRAVESGYAGTTSDDPALALAVRDSLARQNAR